MQLNPIKSGNGVSPGERRVTLPNQVAVLDRVGGDSELLQEMAQLFLEEYPSQLQAVRDAVAAGDPKAVERSAHSLKGSVGNFGAAEAHHAAFQLEMLGRQAHLDSAKSALLHLERALQSLHGEMESLATVV
jgi:HPt (histidine-containing phosphotransfer) domain-containing protein